MLAAGKHPSRSCEIHCSISTFEGNRRCEPVSVTGHLAGPKEPLKLLDYVPSMLILIAHGSPNRQWRASVEKLTESLQVDLGQDTVRLCYMEGDPPTLMDVASEAVRSGIKRLRVLPLFLTSEGHVDRNIRPLVDEVRNAFGGVDIEFLPPIGQHPLFQKLLREIAVQSTET